MHMHMRVAAVLGCLAALAMVGCSTNNGMTPVGSTTQSQSSSHSISGPGWHEENGVLFHTPHYLVTRRNGHHGGMKGNISLSYGGGPVLVTPTTYLILWGYKKYGDPDKVAKLLKKYMKVEGGSSHDNVYDQYYMTSGSSTIYITNPTQQLAGILDDETNPVPTNPSDSQVAQEALYGVQHFGYNANASYVVATPHGHSTIGFATSWCAYHSDTVYSNQYVSYTNLPYMPDALGNCGANIISPPKDESGIDEGVTIVEGHEYGESITDPTPFNGWNSAFGEIGDLCAWYKIANDPFGKKSYTMQPMWSNSSGACEQGM
jgi:serine protease